MRTTAMAMAALLLLPFAHAGCDILCIAAQNNVSGDAEAEVNSASRLLPAEAGVPGRVAQAAPLRVTLAPRRDGDELHDCDPTTLDAQVAALHGALVSFVVTRVGPTVIVQAAAADDVANNNSTNSAGADNNARSDGDIVVPGAQLTVLFADMAQPPLGIGARTEGLRKTTHLDSCPVLDAAGNELKLAVTLAIQSVAPADPTQQGALSCAARAMVGATLDVAVAHTLADARWGVFTAFA